MCQQSHKGRIAIEVNQKSEMMLRWSQLLKMRVVRWHPSECHVNPELQRSGVSAVKAVNANLNQLKVSRSSSLESQRNLSSNLVSLNRLSQLSHLSGGPGSARVKSL